MITNIVNGKKYIGQAVSYSSGKKWGSTRRWRTHVRQAENNRCECRLLENAIRKYGEKMFSVKDIMTCKISELNLNEETCISDHNTLSPNGYNLMTGGGNGRKHSDETKKMMSQTRSGKTHTDETKRRIGESNKGLVVSKEGKQNIGKASRRRNMSESNKYRLENALSELEIEDLPMYVSLSVDKRNENIDKIVVRIPNKKIKTYSGKNISLSDKIRSAIEYINVLNGHRSEESS